MAGYFDSSRPADDIIGGLNQGASAIGNWMQQEQQYQRQQEELSRPLADPNDIQSWIDKLGPEKVRQIAEHPGDVAELAAQDRVQNLGSGGISAQDPRQQMVEQNMPAPSPLSGGMQPVPRGVNPDSSNYPEARSMLHGYLGQGMPAPREAAPQARSVDVTVPKAQSAPREAPVQAPARQASRPVTARDWPQVQEAMRLQQSREGNETRASLKEKDIAAKFGLKQYEQDQINARFGEKNVREWAKLDAADGNNRIKTAVALEAMRNRLEIALIAAQSSKDKVASNDTMKYLSIIAGLQGKLGSSMNLQDMPEVQNMLQAINGHLNQTTKLIEPTLGMKPPSQPAATGPAGAKAPAAVAPKAPASGAPPAGAVGRSPSPDGSYEKNGKKFRVRSGWVFPE